MRKGDCVMREITMNRYSIIEHANGHFTVSEEPVLGSPLFTPCKNMDELCDALSRILGVEINHYPNMTEWQKHIERINQEFTQI